MNDLEKHLLILLVCYLVVPHGILAQKNYIIRKVSYEIEDVFSPNQIKNPYWYYNTANKLHVRTKKRVLEQYVLFQEGDSLDWELIAESERNLRDLDFLGVATITVDTSRMDSIHVNVYTEDQWSILFGIDVDYGGGLTTLGLSLSESNFLGTGKILYVEAIDESDVGTTWNTGYFDPLLFGSRWTGGLVYGNGPLLDGYSIAIDRPFYKSDDNWSGGFSYDRYDQLLRFFQDGEETSRYTYFFEQYRASVKRAFGKRYKRTTIRLSYRHEVNEYDSLPEQTTEPIPPDELLSALSIQIKLRNHSWVKETQIDKFVRIEDITIGRTTEFLITRAGIPADYGIRRWEYGVAHRHRFRLSDSQLLEVNGSFFGEETQNNILRLGIKYYLQTSSSNTLALNARFTNGWDLLNSRQFILGGTNGLRGFLAREFTGAGKFVLNLETRIFPHITVLSTQLGAVAFYDAGQTWEDPDEVDLSNLNHSIGVGLRIGFAKSPGSPVARIDLGFPTSEKGRNPEFAIGIGQWF